MASRPRSAKLAATGDPQALVADYDQYGVGEAQNLIGRTLRLTAGICTRDLRQLIPQFLGRLTNCTTTTDFLVAARRELLPPAILTRHPSLIPPGGPETARLVGHLGTVNALCVLPDGRLASGSMDKTIRLWEVERSAETGRLDVHSDIVSALCVLPDGRLACSSSQDTTIRLWDVETGAETAILKGHSECVLALCVLPDGRLASGSQDSTIRLWDIETGTETAILEGHSGPVKALRVLPDGRLASASQSMAHVFNKGTVSLDDAPIRLWDVTTCSQTGSLDGGI
jgi:WD40 repeat protein